MQCFAEAKLLSAFNFLIFLQLLLRTKVSRSAFLWLPPLVLAKLISTARSNMAPPFVTSKLSCVLLVLWLFTFLPVSTLKTKDFPTFLKGKTGMKLSYSRARIKRQQSLTKLSIRFTLKLSNMLVSTPLK